MKRKISFLIFVFLFSLCQLSAQDKRPKVGVVLSGGGAKGYAHIGALKVIEAAGVKIDYIGGTSIGAIIGGLYASGYSAEELEEIMYSLDLNSLIMNEKSRKELPFFDKSYREKYILELPFDNFKLGFPNAISSGQGTSDELTYLFRHVHDINDFNELPIPFVCVATKLSNGESVVFHEGYLPQVVTASGAYPTLLEPVYINGEMYIDGGVRNNYPVQEVIDLGADYIIGIDLQEGLLDQEQLNSATKVIEQIISYNISEKSKQQSELVDLSIRPDLVGYSVTSFDQKDQIITAGIVAAEGVYEQLEEIARLQGNQKISHKPIESNEYVLITDLEINGLENYNRSYIKGKLGITPPHLVSYENIRLGIKSLYSSGNFNKIYYRIKENDKGHKTLSIFLRENASKQSVKFGLHYDDLFKTGLLVNFTSKHFLFDNSTLSADLVLGDFPRYEFNYYVDNGLYPSFGIYSGFKQFDTDARPRSYSDSAEDVSYLYKFNEFVNQAYIQSTLFEKYALGGGIEHKYLDIKTKNLPASDPNRRIENSYFLSAYGYFKADNLDNPNFPRNGLKFNGTFKYLFSSNTDEFNETSMISTNLEGNKSLNSWISIKGFGEFGTYLSNYPPRSQKFGLGGYVEQQFMTYSRFYGLPFLYVSGDNLMVLGSKLQARILKNHYLSGFVNFANVEDNFDELNLLNYKYVGYGLGYGYDSPLGPIIGMWTYSPNTKSGLFNVSLGFWF
ncbi:patatin-like phospholipase family protein [Moheibacter sp.]|uniref:patatin-like phospholipase family protein n=1 Tax=Moheibacter sp. TaxID=1965316 RepID=UPI003C72D504